MKFRENRNCIILPPWLMLLAVVLTAASLEASSHRRTFLGAGEVAAIAGGSAGIGFLGYLTKKSAEGDDPRWTSPILFEASLQKTLGGRYYPGKTNFLDNTFGSAISGLTGAGIIAAADFGWVDDERNQVAVEDLFLYSTGILATKGITDLAKGLFRRQRPSVAIYPELASRRESIDSLYDQQAFFSGHTSGAFYAMAFVNLRLRAIMRQEMSPEEYRDWRWAPPTLLFSWATFVGWSRIHSYKHYFFDVLAGAAVGVALAELFYSLQKEADAGPGVEPAGSARMFRVTIRF